MKTVYDMEKVLDEINEEIEELKELNSNLHKRGIETQITQIRFLNLRPKIKMFKVTKSEEDYGIIQNIIASIKHEITEVSKGSDFENVLLMIDNVSRALAKGNKKSAIMWYNKLEKYYRELPEDLRRLVHPTCIHLYERIN